MLTKEQFVASKKSMTKEDAFSFLRIDANWSDTPKVLVYADMLYIEDYEQEACEIQPDRRGRYYLTLDRDYWIEDNLEYLEKLLYEAYVEIMSEE